MADNPIQELPPPEDKDNYPMFTPDGRLVSQEESRKIYGEKPVSHLDGPMQRATIEDAAK